jgi:predicted nuclease of restriction endonuclease-like (RecB) superfamily
MVKKNKDIEISEPRMVKSHDVKLDVEYAEWIAEIKHRYRSAQVKAAVKVNGEKLLFNWQLGRDLVQKKAEERWGAGVVEQVSLDLKKEFPNEDGFSTSNLWYMKKWYLFYTHHISSEKLQRLVGELQSSINQERIKLQRTVGELVKQSVSETENDTSNEFPLPFALVPWGQHIEIITRSESLEEALFYMQHVIEKGLSRTALVNSYKAHLYEHQGKIVNNFSRYLPEPQSHLVQEVLKENYDFGFATVDHEPFEERELEDALTSDVTNLLLEMGTGFAFMGRQKEIIVGGRSRKIDLLFYHVRLRCYIACEIKVKPFEPEFTGKLNYYVSAVDELLKAPDDNPTIGLLICSDMDKTDVQWSFRGIATPMGVATYNNIRIKDMLPTQEQLKERMELLQKELRATKRLMKKASE